MFIYEKYIEKEIIKLVQMKIISTIFIKIFNKKHN